ncbi:B12-binding domain-containing radical SAM protein [Rhodococcus erythropolis]|uniref:B12-binding domain-containing radical SAM protein n=1 Tax=Rhodococcus erythropolis TaxID=1833 RepID=UPI001BE8E2DF|nr:radical SAM protein [Rhodococcus erythropolis]MBT2269024.1 hypothetical protein [Rhodococcus erythropolis]
MQFVGESESTDHGSIGPDVVFRPESPAAVTEILRGAFGGSSARRVAVTGTFERRLAIIESSDPARVVLAELSGEPLGTREWPEWCGAHISVDDPAAPFSSCKISTDFWNRIERPRMLLTALYHPEYFPLPRFPLGISDIARAARATLIGNVDMMDMQLGTSVEDIEQKLAAGDVDILGISATFGQHDLMKRLLGFCETLEHRPLVLAGGSLTARNERLLLAEHPHLLVARSAGEPTVNDIMHYWHGDIQKEQIRGLGYAGATRGEGMLSISRYRRTPTVPNSKSAEAIPELDLLPATFDSGGVAQLEASRGCTNYCSFCPRGHKGSWSGASSEQFQWLLPAMSDVFDRYPRVSRTLYFVDEEFIGRGPAVVDRALTISQSIADHRFKWETSCRIDQVAHPDQSRSWHVERAEMWRTLVDNGLRRCLFGIESGVTSILERFNKETTSEQNAHGIRLLSALGVPTRFTYITFDHLMSLDELKQTVAFQQRTDLIIRPLPGMSAEEIVDGLDDQDFIAKHSSGTPFYEGISYMLVSMECLADAAYTRQVAAAGLVATTRSAMGSVEARFADWRIGEVSASSQLWVDRNFALDYTLKSLEKTLDGAERTLIRQSRLVLKQKAADVLGRSVELCERHEIDSEASSRQTLQSELESMRDACLSELHEVLDEACATVVENINPTSAERLRLEFDRWSTPRAWELINAADSCE